VLVADINTGIGSSSPRILEYGDYIAAYTPNTGNELWRLDRFTDRIELVMDINPSTGSSNPFDFTTIGQFIPPWYSYNMTYFSAENASSGNELWAIPSGTYNASSPGQNKPFLIEIRAGINGSNPTKLYRFFSKSFNAISLL
jgi:ELWxxDGT repeat protein